MSKIRSLENRYNKSIAIIEEHTLKVKEIEKELEILRNKNICDTVNKHKLTSLEYDTLIKLLNSKVHIEEAIRKVGIKVDEVTVGERSSDS